MSKKPSYFDQNYSQLIKLCFNYGFEIQSISDDQYRVFGATHIFDIWPARMVYHRIGGENILANEPYSHSLDWEFNEEQVLKLLTTGELK